MLQKYETEYRNGLDLRKGLSENTLKYYRRKTEEEEAGEEYSKHLDAIGKIHKAAGAKHALDDDEEEPFTSSLKLQQFELKDFVEMKKELAATQSALAGEDLTVKGKEKEKKGKKASVASGKALMRMRMVQGHLTAQLALAFMNRSHHYHHGEIFDIKTLHSWMPAYQGVSCENGCEELGMATDIILDLQMILSYIVSWFFWFYYILSADETFPTDKDVKAALAAKTAKQETEETQATMAKCERLFWFQPATTLRGLLPGLLDRWDVAYRSKILPYEKSRRCDRRDAKWVRMWKQYANMLVDEMIKMGNASTYVKLPTRATARMRYFLFNMSDFHNTSIFPTKSFIRDLTASFDDAREAFCDVRTAPYYRYYIFIS